MMAVAAFVNRREQKTVQKVSELMTHCQCRSVTQHCA
jgi:hypothetical protein